MIADTVFKQYDLRGIIGSDFPLEDVYSVGMAIATYFIRNGQGVKTVAVGADGRIHSPYIKEKICEALQDAGLNVIFIGICPTPVLYFSLFTQDVQAGLMITASHNGKEYNGIKICMHKESVWGDGIQEIKKIYRSQEWVQVQDKGSYVEHVLIPEYILCLKKHFSHLIGMPLSAVVDCGNGAAGTVLPALVKVMEWSDVKLLFSEVDGTYPNHEADPTVPENMQEVKRLLLTTDVQVGIGLDGDCDRMAPMTKEGELVQGDKLLALFARGMVQEKSQVSVVFDIKCSSGLPELLTEWGAKPIMSPSGHSIIKSQMKQHHALLAGELSCHFFFKDRYFGYDDGIYSMMRLFEIVVSSGKSLHELLAIFPKKYSTSEIRIACPDEKKDLIVDAMKNSFAGMKDVEVMTIDGIRVTMKNGWGMFRPSNTQPVVCLRFEGNSEQDLQLIKNTFLTHLKPYFDTTTLEAIHVAR